jgi:hypothetical protein
MPKVHFIVRAVVADESLHDKFDRWYANDHLARALKDFKAEKAWRGWSAVEAGVHYAVYQFTDKEGLDAALASEAFKALVADFDRNFPSAVTRTRDVLMVAEELDAA